MSVNRFELIRSRRRLRTAFTGSKRTIPRCALITAAFCVVALPGCFGDDQDSAADPEIPPVDALPDPTRVFGIGDVDSAMDMVLELAEESMAPNITEGRTEGLSGRLMRVNLEVQPPHPGELSLTITAKSDLNFPEHAVLVNVRVLRSEDEIDAYAFVAGARARTEPFIRTVDVLQGLDQPPETMLVRTDAVATLFLDTDPSTITPDSVPPVGAPTATLRGNPVRIDFK